MLSEPGRSTVAFMRDGCWLTGEAFKNAGDAVVDATKTAYNKTATFAQQRFDGTRREINTLEGVLQVSRATH